MGGNQRCLDLLKANSVERIGDHSLLIWPISLYLGSFAKHPNLVIAVITCDFRYYGSEEASASCYLRGPRDKLIFSDSRSG